MRDPRPEIGDLRHKLTWQTRTAAPADGSCGQDVEAWTTRLVTSAQILPSGGSIVFNGDQLKAVREQRIRVRGGPAIAAGDRLLFLGRTLDVTSACREEERGFWLVITATEQATGQPGGP